MTLRYFLVVLCAVLPLGTLCNASDSGHYLPRAPTGWVSDQQRWRSLQQSQRPLYPRLPYKPASRLYPRWPIPNTDPHNLRVRWPNAKPATPLGPSRAQQTHVDLRDATPRRPDTPRGSQVSSRRSASRLRSLPVVNTRSGSLASSLRLTQPRQGRRGFGKQWIWPRKYFSSAGSTGGSTGSRLHSTGRTTPRTCSNGKVWRAGACVCPYLSNWSAEKNKCECVYGTYRNASGHCQSY